MPKILLLKFILWMCLDIWKWKYSRLFTAVLFGLTKSQFYIRCTLKIYYK